MLLLSVGACGQSQPQQASSPSAPSLAVNFDLTIPLKGHRITGITLTPSGLPSGVVAVQTVHDGRVTTIGSQRFSKPSIAHYCPVAHFGRFAAVFAELTLLRTIAYCRVTG